MSVYCIDIDGTLTTGPGYYEYTDEEVMRQIPNQEMIGAVNKLYEQGNTIILNTARIWANFEITVSWLKLFGVKYHTLVMGKPLAHYYIDDKNLSISDFLQKVNKEENLIFSSPKCLMEKSLCHK